MNSSTLTGHATVRTTCAGFSVLEALTATGVAAVLLAVGAPHLPSFHARFQLIGGARQIAVELQRARMKAVGENAFYRIVFNSDGTYVRQSSPDGTTFTADAVSVALPAGVHFVIPSGGLPQPTFNRLGVLGAQSAVALTNSIGQTRVVQINTMGQISISSG